MGSIFLRMFKRRERREKKDEFWVAADKRPAAVPAAFYCRLNTTLKKMDFARKDWEICEPASAEPSRGRRPGIDPAVYLKMLIIGFFEACPGNVRLPCDTRTA